MSTNLQIIIKELQDRIGQITSQYELQLASLKAEAMTIIDEKNKEIEELKNSDKSE